MTLSTKKRSPRLDRQLAVIKMDNGEPLSQYDVDLLQIMPSRKKQLAAHIEAQKAGLLSAAAAVPEEDEAAPTEPATAPPKMTVPVPGRTVPAARGVESVDEAMFKAWVAGLPPMIQKLLTKTVPDRKGALFNHKAAQMLAANGAPDRDIATLLGIEKSLLQLDGKAALELGRTQYRFMLHQRQLMAAMAGDRTILQLLGKHKLGQNDKLSDGPGGSGEAERADAVKRAKEKLSRVISEARGTRGPNA